MKLAICAFLLVFPLGMQAESASITGTVQDATGAVVQGASISAQNLATNISRRVQSGASGSFAITNLPAGSYDVTAEKSGFRPMRYSRVELTTSQVLALNPKFQVSATSEVLEVSGDTVAPIDLETSQLSNVVDQRRIQDLPLLTRNPYELVLLSPGASQTNTSLGGITVNGARERNNNFLLDGVDNNDTSVPGILGGALSADPNSTQEFRVITNAFAAEFGRNTGAIVDVVTKSGSNGLHGDAYWFGRYNGFGGARDWFNRKADGKQNPYVRNQFGYSVGGPIIKDKTFFFFNHEIDRFRTTLTNSSTVPTAAFKTGVFTFIDPNGVATPVDLTSPAQNKFGLPLDPTVQSIFALYPNPTTLNGDGFSGQVLFPSASQQDSYQTVAKIDHRLTGHHMASFRYGYGDTKDPNAFHNDILPGVGAVGIKAISQGLSAKLVSTLAPTLVNDFNFGWNHIYGSFSCGGTSILNSVSPLDSFGRGRDYQMNPFTGFGCLRLVADSQFRRTGTISYSDTLTWVKNRHTFKFGGDFRNVGESGPSNFLSRRQVDLRAVSIFGPANSPIVVANATPALGDAASALYGLVAHDTNAEFFDKSGTRVATDDKSFRQHESDFFAQDSWKLRQNLTLNLGLRYQYNGVPFEENGNFSNLLTDPASFPVVFSTVGAGTGRQIYRDDYSNIEPRIGFAWDPFSTGKTSLRGAYGIYHDRVFGNLFGNARANPPFEQDYQQFPFETINDAFGSGGFPMFVPAQTPSANVPDDTGLEPVIFDTHFRNASSQNWNLGVQREFFNNLVIDLNYAASKGTHIYRQLDGNPPDPALVAQLVAFCSNPGNSFGCTPETVTFAALYFGGDPNFGALPFNAVAHNALFQPFYQRSIGNSSYQAMQLKVTRRMTHGLEVQGAYTWAHGIDDSADALNPAGGNRTFPRNSRNVGAERGNSDNDIRHRAVINYIWEVPLGAGRSYLNSGWMGRVFEGLQFSGISTLQSGHPFEVYSNTDSEHTGVSNRADLVGDPFASSANSTSASGRVFFTNPTAFAEPAFGGPGNIGRNHFYGPHYVNFDMALSKKMKLTERFGLETRAELYNIFNHPQFKNPGDDPSASGNQLGTGIFGVSTSTITRSDATTSARQLQVAMKVTF